jgi:hypothetical protein
MDEEIVMLKSDERQTIVEIEAFLKVLTNMASRFIKPSYVRKKGFIQIIVSNIIITTKREVKIKLHPHIQTLIDTSFLKNKKDSRKGISFGALTPNLFEHIYKVVSSIPIREMMILSFFIDVNPNHPELLNQLTEDQLLLY